MASKVAQVADAVKALIDAHGAAIGEPVSALVEAERVFVPELDLQDLAELRVTVLPAGLGLERDSRNSHQHDYAVNIGVRKKVATVEPEELDPLLEVVELLIDALRANPIATADLGNLPAIAIANEPVFSVAMLQEQQLFVSVVSATYRARRAQ